MVEASPASAEARAAAISGQVDLAMTRSTRAMRMSSPVTRVGSGAFGAGIGVLLARAIRSSKACCGSAPPKPHRSPAAAQAAKKRR